MRAGREFTDKSKEVKLEIVRFFFFFKEIHLEGEEEGCKMKPGNENDDDKNLNNEEASRRELGMPGMVLGIYFSC